METTEQAITRAPETSIEEALSRMCQRLSALQAADGSWEGEDIWNPMLPAQYVIAMQVIGRPIDRGRAQNILQQFEHEKLANGLWGLHRFGEPSLFMTALVYVASRLLGVKADHPSLAEARKMLAKEDLLSIPSWGKIWLSIAGVYEWKGAHSIPPEVWMLPKSARIHPANYYCHTRLIYMGMASVSAEEITAPITDLTREIRKELYPGRNYEELPWVASRGKLRAADLYAEPTKTLQAMYWAGDAYSAVHFSPLRKKILRDLRKRMKWELDSSDFTCLSPVNGLLFMLTLWNANPSDPYVERQLARFEGWVWEDEHEGMRIAGARSATWDSSFALQALSRAYEALPTERPMLRESIERGLEWLRTQQIETPAIDDATTYRKMDRVDPTGGFCFAGVWHGWPVSDCTAEAICAFLEAPPELRSEADLERVRRGIEFMLRCQNSDGGFGSYEARKNDASLEWMNPAEMFGDSMTEMSYVECTASNAIAIVAALPHLSGGLRTQAEASLKRAEALLRSMQRPDGSWEGVWGVATLYGTFFALRALHAIRSHHGEGPDAAMKKAGTYIASMQREDGGFGEHWRTCATGRSEDLGYSHCVQTGWALSGLASVSEHREARERASAWLESQLEEDGELPEQIFAGVFFRTALIGYRMYRRIFPMMAVAEHLNAK